MIIDPDSPATRNKALQARAKLLYDIRSYFGTRDVLEIETPIISAAGNTDPEIQSIRTTPGGYLRTSPEFAMKRLLAEGCGDIFELGRVFRDGEAGHHHNPEFTLLEWYRLDWHYHELMDEVSDLVRYCGQGQFNQWPEKRFSYRDLFIHYLQIDPYTASAKDLSDCAGESGAGLPDLDRRQWLGFLISHKIQPSLPSKGLTFVFDFPSDQAALARIRTDDSQVAERFELYLGKTELANGYQELTDATEQGKRFEDENIKRKARGMPTCEVDRNLLQAMQRGLPECAGVALGVDRLLMSITGADTISDVLAFPSHLC